MPPPNWTSRCPVAPRTHGRLIFCPACAYLAGAEWAAGIKVDFDTNSLKTGIGGVEVVGFGGKITLTNTLQSRLMLAYETQLPALRATLFT